MIINYRLKLFHYKIAHASQKAIGALGGPPTNHLPLATSNRIIKLL